MPLYLLFNRCFYPVCSAIKDEFTALAAQKNLHLRTRYGDNWLEMRIGLGALFKTFWHNAVHCTASVAILDIRRRRGDFFMLKYGTAALASLKTNSKIFFQEFKRLDHKIKNERFGFGFIIVERTAKRLGYRIEVGSLQVKAAVPFDFALTQAQEQASTPTQLTLAARVLNGLKTLIMDNDANVIAEMNTLLQSWQMPNSHLP